MKTARIEVAKSEDQGRSAKIANGERIDKSVLFLGTERRLRDKTHLKNLNAEPCLICARLPSHAHHLTFAQRRGLSQKVSDEFVVPLCALHHGELHQSGSERDWWKRYDVDPLPIAQSLWARTRQVISSEVTSTDVAAVAKSEMKS
jgi:hypothetical protein